MKKLPVDLEELACHMEDATGDMQFYLDRETGKLEMLLGHSFWDGDSDEVHIQELKARIKSEPDRYALLPRIASWEGHQIMADFIETVQDVRFAERLSDAIRGRGAFRRFKDAVADDGEERQRWFRYHEERMIQDHVLPWLTELGIDPIDTSAERRAARQKQ